ncbi:restriction endonuclease subunit S [Emticicia sp. TH156]|uniref:restriction endonuclease subunit S n=1 Tax=Emticicia sp. TH156 TaxID=2067454 RepID=UPI000C76EE05|nr:restriction endonuclease subunit S [Emticicia sp. TH156]PLK46114.1 hypothetical protein C0V77_01845 [Emticicia sp. TH156]
MSEWKETDIGLIPIHWELKNIDEIKSSQKKSIISGPFGSNISAKYFVNEGVPVVRGNNLSLDIHKRFIDNGFVFVNEEKAEELGTWAEKDDIIFTAVGTIGQVGILQGNEIFTKYIISNKQLRLRVDKQIVNPLYAYYWFASPFMTDMILQRNTGSSVPLINLSVLKSLLIPIPSKKEQDIILDILSSLDDKIDLLHRQNATLEKMAETLFRQWFVEEAKEEWEEKLLGELIEIKGGFTYKSDFIGNGSSKLLGMGCVSNKERFLTSGSRLYSGECPEKYLAQPGDLIIATRQQSDNLPILGFPAIVPEDFLGQKVIVGANLYRVINNSSLSNYLMYLILKSKNYKSHITSSAKGSTVRMITKDAIESFLIVLPPKEIIHSLEQAIHPINSKSITINKQIQTLTALRDTLLPKLMSGEVKVEC